MRQVYIHLRFQKIRHEERDEAETLPFLCSFLIALDSSQIPRVRAIGALFPAIRNYPATLTFISTSYLGKFLLYADFAVSLRAPPRRKVSACRCPLTVFVQVILVQIMYRKICARVVPYAAYTVYLLFVFTSQGEFHLSTTN